MARQILLLITDLEIGGTPTVVRELAVRLHQPPEAYVEVACLSRWGPVAEQLVSAGIHVHALDAASSHDLRVIRRLVKLIRQRHHDTVFSFLIHANAVAAAASLACREVRFLQSIQTTQPTPRWHWWLQRLISHAAQRLIVPSPSVAQAAREWAGIPADKITVIPNAIDPESFGPSDAGPGPASQTPFPIGFIGRLDPIKRIDDLLQAVHLLGDRVHLHIFGQGSERAHIEEQIATLGIASRVTLHGAIARPQEALGMIGLLVLPSAAEGFGLVLIEAMAAGVPVVATNVAGIRDVVRDGQTGLLVPAMAPQSLAQAIRRILDDAPLRQTLIQQAHAEVPERFAWAKVIPQYRELLCVTSTDEHRTSNTEHPTSNEGECRP